MSNHVRNNSLYDILFHHPLLHLEGNVQGWHLALVQELQRRRGNALSGRRPKMGGVVFGFWLAWERDVKTSCNTFIDWHRLYNFLIYAKFMSSLYSILVFQRALTNYHLVKFCDAATLCLNLVCVALRLCTVLDDRMSTVPLWSGHVRRGNPEALGGTQSRFC